MTDTHENLDYWCDIWQVLMVAKPSITRWRWLRNSRSDFCNGFCRSGWRSSQLRSSSARSAWKNTVYLRSFSVSSVSPSDLTSIAQLRNTSPNSSIPWPVWHTVGSFYPETDRNIAEYQPVLYGIHGIQRYKRQDVGVFSTPNLSYWALIGVGLFSGLYHTTLKYHTQMCMSLEASPRLVKVTLTSRPSWWAFRAQCLQLFK